MSRRREREPFWTDYWRERLPVQPSPVLERLAEFVLRQSTKRAPIWKFRLAPDLLISMQPKVEVGFLADVPRIKENLVPIRFFKCRAVQGADVTLASLTTRSGNPRIMFLVQDWRIKHKSVTGFGSTYGADSHNNLLLLDQRIVAAFNEGFFENLRPDRMVGHFCMCCGKGLSDPVSMARLIGPECFGSNSEDLPMIVRIHDREA